MSYTGREMIKEKLEQAIQKALIELQESGKLHGKELPQVVLEHPENSDHGDYSTNIAFLLAPQLKKGPIETAEFLVEQTRASIEGAAEVRQVEIAGSGFINIYLSIQYLAAELLRVLQEGDAYGSQKARKKKMVLDYSGPNIAKPFGIGHLRSTIIGQALYNLYSFLGWSVIGDNHLGDWGTPHGKILYQLKTKKLADKNKKETREILNNLTIQDLEELYIEFGKEAEQNLGIEEEARIWFSKLEQGDKEARMMWEHAKEISIREFRRIYKLLGVQFDYEIGESFYAGMFDSIVRETRKKKVAIESEGALIIPFPEEKLPPALMLKSDGATNYFIRDLATIAYRLKKWKPDMLVYETGVEQTLNFQQLFWAAELLGWADRKQFAHVVHGLYRGKEGKFSTRKGHTVHLEEVLQEAVERAKNIINTSETSQELSETERERIAMAVGIGGVKYNDLAQLPRKDIVFDWDKILNLKGNSAPYLQYTYVRCASILHKAGSTWPSKTSEYENLSAAELDVARAMYEFGEVVQDAADKFSPNILCTYLFDLAQKYNTFYNTHSVIGADNKDQKEFRLMLTAAAAQVLKSGLTLLGITVLDRM
jgi:arginyl-tRNA synthetase